MAQGVDGNWYGYFADRDQALIADSTSNNEGSGLDFGSFCSATTAERVLGIDLADTDGVAIANASRAVGDDNDGSATGGAITASCYGVNANGDNGDGGGITASVIQNNVVREAKQLSDSTATDPGADGNWGEREGRSRRAKALLRVDDKK
jgi:hypothetical protein